MAEYDITTQDGRVFKITAPEGTSEQDIAKYAQEVIPKPAGLWDRFTTGLGDIPRGIKQFVANAVPDSLRPLANQIQGTMAAQPVSGVAARALGPLGTPQQENAAVAQREADYKATLPPDVGMDWPRIVGNVTATIPAAALTPTGFGILPAAAYGAALGGASGLAAPAPNPNRPYWDQALESAQIGAAGGAAAGVVGNVIGKVLAPKIPANVRALHDAGVVMTPGQIAGGATRRVEEGLGSVPVLGDTIRSGQRYSVETLNRSTANAVLDPIGKSVPKDTQVGRTLVNQVHDMVTAAFDQVAAKIKPFTPDAQWVSDLSKTLKSTSLMQPQRDYVRQVLGKELSERLARGPLTASEFKQVIHNLRLEGRTWMGASDLKDRAMSQVFFNLASDLNSLAARRNPGIAKPLASADQAWARLVRFEDAAGRQGAKEGVITANQLQAAVRRQDKSYQHRAFARGDALLQGLSDPASAVLPATVPDSGTPLRLLTAAGGLAATVPDMSPALGAAAGAAAMYSPTGLRAIQNFALYPRPLQLQLMGDLFRAIGPVAGNPVAQQYAQPPRIP